MPLGSADVSSALLNIIADETSALPFTLRQSER